MRYEQVCSEAVQYVKGAEKSLPYGLRSGMV